MPRFLEAGGTFDYVLLTDRQLTPAPTFKLKVLSKRDSRTLKEVRQKYLKTDDQLAKDDVLSEATRLVVKGWENMPVLFCESELENLTELECWELINAATLEAVLSPEDRKKFESQSKSETV